MSRNKPHWKWVSGYLRIAKPHVESNFGDLKKKRGGAVAMAVAEEKMKSKTFQINRLVAGKVG